MNDGMFSAHVEVRRRRVSDDELDRLIQVLSPWHASLSESDRGWLAARLTLPAEGLLPAVMTVHALAAQHLGEPIVLEVMPEGEWSARQGFVPVPDLIGAAEAAEAIGVTRQRVIQMVEEGKLPGQVVGRSTVIPRAAVVAWVERSLAPRGDGS